MSDNIIQLNEAAIKGELKELVKNSVEETLNALLDHEADELVKAERYERTGERQGYRSGHYDRSFTTTSGEVTLHVPKLKGVQFETAIIERYRRRETSIEEALIEMYLAGISVRRVEDITEALWGTRVSSGTISNLNQKAYENIEKWRCRPLDGRYAYVYVDGVYLKRSWGGEVQNVSVLVAIGVNEDGYREILGAAEGIERTGPKRCPPVYRRQESWDAGNDRRSVPGSKVSALYRPFLPECFFGCPAGKDPHGIDDAESDPRAGKQRGSPQKSKRSCRRAAENEASRSREEGRGQYRRDPHLYGFSQSALDQDPDQQYAGASEPGDQAANEGHRRFPGWQQRLNAGLCQAPPCGRKRLGNQTIHEYGSPAGDGYGTVSRLMAGKLPATGWKTNLRKKVDTILEDNGEEDICSGGQ